MQDQTRRQFVKSSAAIAASVPLASVAGRAYASGSDEVGVGVVGCGGRGTGAVHNCLTSYEGVKLKAMCDVKASICKGSRDRLSDLGERIDVPDENIFEGIDGYKSVIHHPDVDLVILTTPPGFRPLHLREAVEAGRHVFAEKPVCVDATGYRSCIESGKIARKNGTAIVTGTMYRRQPSYMDAIAKIHEGAIGDITGGLAYYCSTGIWYRGREEGMSDAMYQMRNWYHFLWLCGDQIVEQAVHNLDAINWTMGGPPVKCFGHGGQMTRPSDSEIYDHMSIDYEYANGAIVSFKCRQIPNTQVRVLNTIVGTEGTAFVNPSNSEIVNRAGERIFRVAQPGNNPYVREHADLLSSIRSGEPIVEIEETADSSLTAVMGRMAAYSGREVTFEFAKNSKEDLYPAGFRPDGDLPSKGVVIPGQYELI